MIRRTKDNYIGTHIDGDVAFYFYFENKAHEEERKIAGAILNKANRKVVADALWEQLHSELNTTCRTELVKEVFIDVGSVYYPISSKGNRIGGSSPRPTHAQDAINMDFYTDYLIQQEIREGLPNLYWGFYCCETIGRFSRKQKKFTEISNNMLSKCDLM